MLRPLHACVSLIKVSLSLDRAPDAAIAARRDICRACPHATRKKEFLNRPSRGLTTLSRCGKLTEALKPGSIPCGCFIALKTRLASESCPLGRWAAATPQTLCGGSADGPQAAG
jgi:hypothetical protein